MMSARAWPDPLKAGKFTLVIPAEMMKEQLVLASEQLGLRVRVAPSKLRYRRCGSVVADAVRCEEAETGSGIGGGSVTTGDAAKSNQKPSDTTIYFLPKAEASPRIRTPLWSVAGFVGLQSEKWETKYSLIDLAAS